MATDELNFFDVFFDDVHEGKHTFASDTIKVALTNTAPSSSGDTVFADIDEITAANGYTAGGQALDNVTSTQTLGTYTLTADDEVFTATGAWDTFRYVVIYNDSEANDALIGWLDYGSGITLTGSAPAQTFTVAFLGNEVFTTETA